MHGETSAEGILSTASLATLAARLRGVSVGTKSGDIILKSVDFEVRPASMVVVSGPPGAGKTALMDVLRLALRPTAGDGIVLGADLAKLGWGRRARLKREIGYLAQAPALLEHMTLFENAALPLRLAGAKLSAYADDVEELLQFLGLPESDPRPVAVLSGSARRRCAIARAVVGRPRLILAEEPTAGLGGDLVGKVLRLLGTMRRTGAAVLVTTQDETLAHQLGGAYWRMNEGRLALAAAGDHGE
jgi:cell division transport system ATP-binding protein